MSEIDTTNKFMVSMYMSGDLLIQLPPPRIIPPADALNLAAWLVALAEKEDGEFAKILDAVRAT